MPKYLVTLPFYSAVLGSHSNGEEIECSAEQAGDLVEAGVLVPLKGGPKIETADLQPEAETADVKAPKRKK